MLDQDTFPVMQVLAEGPYPPDHWFSEGDIAQMLQRGGYRVGDELGMFIDSLGEEQLLEVRKAPVPTGESFWQYRAHTHRVPHIQHLLAEYRRKQAKESEPKRFFSRLRKLMA